MVDVDQDIEAIMIVVCTNYLDAAYHAMITTSEHLARTLSSTPLNNKLIADARRYRRSIILDLPTVVGQEMFYRISKDETVLINNLVPHIAKLLQQAK